MYINIQNITIHQRIVKIGADKFSYLFYKLVVAEKALVKIAQYFISSKFMVYI